MNKPIIVVGFPRSGNTWCTRLIAELLNSPVKGFWLEPDNVEQAIEGADRVSKWEVFKSHHIHSLLMESLKKYEDNDFKIIVVVRDPRDVVVSCYHYLPRSPQFAKARKLFSKIPFGLRLFFSLIDTKNVQDKRALTAVNDGFKDGSWFGVGWSEFYNPYVNENFNFIRFEDLLHKPEMACQHILEKSSLYSPKIDLKSGVIKHKFVNKKNDLIKINSKNANFLRSGSSGQWKTILSKSQIQLIEEKNKCLLYRLGYLHPDN